MPGIDKNKLDKFRRGELKFVQIFNIDAKQMAGLLTVGHNFFSQGRLEEARCIFEGLAILDPKTPYVHSILGVIHQRMQEYDKAILRFNRVLQLFPDDISTLTNRGETCLRLGKLDEGARDLKKAAALDPQKKHPSANRARLLAAMAVDQFKSSKRKPL